MTKGLAAAMANFHRVIKLLASLIVGLAILSVGGCFKNPAVSRERDSSGDGARAAASGGLNDWISAVCQFGRYREMGSIPVPNAMCNGYLEGGGFTTLWFFYRFPSASEMNANQQRLLAGYSYAACNAVDGSVTAFVSDVSGIGSNGDAIQLTEQAIQPLKDLGCVVTQHAPKQAKSTSSLQAVPQPSRDNLPSAGSGQLQPTLADADAQGFLNYPEARCNDTNPAVLIARTENSALVICQTGAGRYYYRGYGLVNRMSIEINDPQPTAAGWVLTNNGVQYSISPAALTITQSGSILSNEPMLEFWSK